MYKQHGLLQELNLEKRLEELKNMVYNANKYYYELEKARILMDYADKPEHLSTWNIILDRMSKEILT